MTETAAATRPALHGVTAVVTGASRGIGRAIAMALAAAGAQPVLISRSASDLVGLAAEIDANIGANVDANIGASTRAVVVPCDVTNADAVVRAVQFVRQQCVDGPYILVNNAGVFPAGPVVGTDPALFEQTLQTNLLAPFRFLHAFVPVMRTAGRGHVVTIGSVADRRILIGNGAYSASKFGARALHEVLREEVRGSGIRATLIAPSATDTPLWDPIDPDHTPGFPPRAAMLRAEDVADAVLWAVTRPAHVNIDELRISRA